MFNRITVTKETLPDVHRLFHEIFPDEKLYEEDGGELKSCFDLACEDGRDPNDLFMYWMYKEYSSERSDGELVGMSGIYLEKSDPDSAWLGWIGVRPQFRRHRYGTRILNDFLDICRQYEFKFARLYTNENNVAARRFYEFNGFVGEKYSGDAPECVKTGGDIWIYSKSLREGFDCPPWNNRHLDF